VSAQGIGERVLVLGAASGIPAVPFTPAWHSQILPFLELIDRRLGLFGGLLALGSLFTDAGFETCPAWVAKRDGLIPCRVGVFSSGMLPGSKLCQFASSLARRVRKVSRVARQIIC
jgi:hypothetical protein